MTRRLLAAMAVTACLGTLVFAAGGSGAASAAVSHNRSAMVVHRDVVAQPATAAAVAKFLLHAGAAYYVFDHFIWKPYKAGDLHGFTHKLKIVEAGVAALFVYHEAKEMLSEVKKSKLLTFLFKPVTAFTTKLSNLKSKITGGNLGSLSSVQSDLGAIKQQGKGKGINIKEIVTSL